MKGRFLGLLGLCVAVHSFAASPSSQESPRDLFLGEAFYYSQQGEYFDAISRLDSELGQYYRLDDPKLDPLHFQVNHAEFSVGDFELLYRMHQRAGRALKAVMDTNVSPDVRNEAAYRLARIYYEEDEPEQALQTIEKISGKAPERIRNDEEFLRAQIYMAVGRHLDAIKILDGLRNTNGFQGFAGYNLGIALIEAGREKDGLTQLDKAGLVEGNDEGTLSMRDKSNLVLGYHLLRANQPDAARQYLDRVRIEGPFSDKALLGSGWADVAQGHYDRALVPWSILIKRNTTGKPVQEGLLGVPYSYEKLNLHGRAALLYGSALDSFGQELGHLDSSIKSIEDGNFLKALRREELKQDKNWVVKLRALPESPETYYLTELMASNDFQTALNNYLDLEALRRRLLTWDHDIDAYEDVIALRRKYYEPLLPEVDKRFRVLDSQLRLRMEQRQHLAEKLKNLLTAPRPEFLATADERQELAVLARLEQQYQDDKTPAGDAARERIQRLKGTIYWDIHTTYDLRLTDAYKHLQQLDQDVARLHRIYGEFVRTRQAATQSYEGYDDRIRQARIQVKEAKEKIATLQAQQGHVLEVMAINELEQRRHRLEDYQVQARFAMAESYDRALKDGQATPEAKQK